jgi:lipopolysaccharide export system permease protein
MVPAACLLASVLTFSTLNKHNEIVALRAAGISPLRLTVSLFGLGVVGCVLLLVAQEYLLPYSIRTERQIWRMRIRREKQDMRLAGFKSHQVWYRTENRIWHARQSQPLQNRLLGVTIYQMTETGDIRQRIDATEAIWEMGEWILRHGAHRQFDAQGRFAAPPEGFVEYRAAFPESPAAISALRKEPDEMGIRETLAHAQDLRRHGLPDAQYRTDFHGKLAFSAVCIIMAGFGAPLALSSNRSGGAARAIALTLVCGFSYWIVHSLAMAFGQNGHLPPVIAAWFANICFGAGSLYLVARTR